MSNPNLTEQLEAATQQFKANSPIKAQIKIGQMIEELQKSGIASGKQPGEKALDFKLTNAGSMGIHGRDRGGPGNVAG